MVRWVTPHRLYSLEIEESSRAVCTLVRTRDKDTFNCLASRVEDRFSNEPQRKLSVAGSNMHTSGDFPSIVDFSGCSHVSPGIYASHQGSGYQKELFLIFRFGRLLKPCPEKVSSSIFDGLHPFSMAEFVDTRLTGAEHQNWMALRYRFVVPLQLLN